MQSSTTVEFTRTSTSPPSGGDRAQITLMHRDEDNKTALEVYEEQYQAANNKLPDYASREDRELYITLLEQSLKDSYTAKVRLYSYDEATLAVNSVRSNGVTFGNDVTETSDEFITLLGSSSISADYPIGKVLSLTMELRDIDGTPVTKQPTLGEDLNLYFDTEVYGFVHINYEHTYKVLMVSTTTEKAEDKLSSVLMCQDKNSTAALEVEYEDVIDKFMGVLPDKPEWKVTIRKGRQSMDDVTKDPDDVVIGTVFTEYARTVSTINIEGVTIDRAETVSFKSEDDSELKLIFTSLNGTPPPEGGA
ncbi:hypothetical protein [Vibrio phage V-YDF132]|nr:hypothetical protein [Vibrio phage V-YDF132]